MTTAPNRAAVFFRPRILLIAIVVGAIPTGRIESARDHGRPTRSTGFAAWALLLRSRSSPFTSWPVSRCSRIDSHDWRWRDLSGVVLGSFNVSIASTLGATAAFLVGRYFARDWVSARLEGNAKFKAIDEAVGKEGWKIVILTRMSLVFPFNLLNYAYGLTRVTLRDYFFASWAGMIPGTILYVYIGSLSGDLARAASGSARRTPAGWVLHGGGIHRNGRSRSVRNANRRAGAAREDLKRDNHPDGIARAEA